MDQTDFISPKAQIRASTIQGKGLFANEPIDVGEVVVIWRGTYTDSLGAEQARKVGKLTMQWDTDLFSVEDRGDDDGYFVNHSCDSNLWMKDAFTLIARKPISAGEEITADYALWEFDPHYVAQWDCGCNAIDCRKHITGNDWQLPTVQEKYRGHFSPMIQHLIAKM